MGRNTRRRPTGPRRATFAAVALMLGGGGLVAANVYASATEDPWGAAADGGNRVMAAATIDCPDVGDRLTAVPDAARADVDRQLAALDEQVAAAYRQLQESARAEGEDPGSADDSIMQPLEEKRTETIGRIEDAIDEAGDRPEGLRDLAACDLRASGNQQGGDGQGQDAGDEGDGQNGNDGGDQGGDAQQNGQGQDGRQDGQDQNGNGGQGGNGPVAADYADITTVQPQAAAANPGAEASRGTFSSSCGVNENGLFNSDNIIVAPGVTNGAHHFHDYIGNQANNAFASDEDLANADTTCADKGDKSTYYWPVLRLQDGSRERDADAPGGGTEGNVGKIVTPREVTLTFVGSPRSEVTAMPRLLRIITGDAKAFVNGPGNANASWSCTGFEDRQLKDKYPLCPEGSDVVRTFRFQSCWDGRNIDSANHRTHVAFAAADGSCPDGFRAIPQLVQRIVYDVDPPSLQDGGRTTPLFAVDSFPEQLHKPVTDHGDFINVFDEDLMREVVDCINSGRQCGAGAGQGSGSGEQPEEPQQPGNPQQPAEPQQPGNPQQPTDPQQPGSPQQPTDPQDSQGDAQEQQTAAPGRPAGQPAGDGAPGAVEPKADTTMSATRLPASAAPQGGSAADGAGEIGTPAQPPATAGPQTRPQAVSGGLAETGAQLWPAAAGAVLMLGGFVLLRRVRRTSV